MEHSKAEVIPIQCLKFNGIVYLPHYQDENRYVRPGYGVSHYETYSGLELIALGAAVTSLPLWPRAWGGIK